jgi:anti-sigma regulatory factor (Ser/Thr protein kinase)
MATLRQQFENAPGEIPRIRDAVRKFVCQYWSLEEDTGRVAQLELAVSEAAANIVLHGLGPQSDRGLAVTVDVEMDRACVTLSYQGCPFEPSRVPAPDFSGASESGFGLYLIRNTVDEVKFTRDDSSQCLIQLVKYRNSCPEGSPAAVSDNPCREETGRQ